MKKNIQKLLQQTNLQTLSTPATQAIKGGDGDAAFIISDEIDGL